MFSEKLPVVFVTPNSGGRVERALAEVDDGHALLTLVNQDDVVDFILEAGAKGTPMPALVVVESIGDVSIKVIKELRQEATTRSIPVVVFADQLDQSRLASALEARANSVVRIPEDETALKDVAGIVRKFWLKFNEVAPPPRPSSIDR